MRRSLGHAVLVACLLGCGGSGRRGPGSAPSAVAHPEPTGDASSGRGPASSRPPGPDRAADAGIERTSVEDAGPPPIPFLIPSEVTVPVGGVAEDADRGVSVGVLEAETVGQRTRARVRIVVGHGDHELDLISSGRPLDVDGVVVRLVRVNGQGVVLAVDQRNGWSPPTH